MLKNHLKTKNRKTRAADPTTDDFTPFCQAMNRNLKEKLAESARQLQEAKAWQIQRPKRGYLSHRFFSKKERLVFFARKPGELRSCSLSRTRSGFTLSA